MNANNTPPPEISIVIPFFNEQANVASLLAELRATVMERGWRTEVILIDDGSTDSTAQKLDQAALEWSACRVIHFKRNCGQAAALWHGLNSARAEILMIMDGDGQNAPADLALLLQLMDRADMVVGRRMQRHDSMLRRLMSLIANRVRAAFLGDNLHDTGCALKVMRREVIDSFLPIRTLYSFMPTMAAAEGYRVVETPVLHRRRRNGESKYCLSLMLWHPLLDMIALKWILSRRFPKGRDFNEKIR